MIRPCVGALSSSAVGSVLAASYEARAQGVRTAMGGAQWPLPVPPAVVVEPRMEAYTVASRAVFVVFEDTTPLVEGLSIDGGLPLTPA